MYALPPGSVLPARHTDESIRAAAYFYGPLDMCPKEGKGKWGVYDKDQTLPHALKQLLEQNLITTLHVAGVIAGPAFGAGKIQQWAKNEHPNVTIEFAQQLCCCWPQTAYKETTKWIQNVKIAWSGP